MLMQQEDRCGGVLKGKHIGKTCSSESFLETDFSYENVIFR